MGTLFILLWSLFLFLNYKNKNVKIAFKTNDNDFTIIKYKIRLHLFYNLHIQTVNEHAINHYKKFHNTFENHLKPYNLKSVFN